MKKYILEFCVLFLLITQSAWAANYYVSPSGSGSSYTLGSPGSLSGALTLAGKTGGDNIYCLEGTYAISSTITVVGSGSSDSSRIVVTKAPGTGTVLLQTSETLRDPAIAMDGRSYWTWSYISVHYSYDGILTDPYGDRGFWRVGHNSACSYITWDHITATSDATGDNFGLILIKSNTTNSVVTNSTFTFPTGGHVSTGGVVVFTAPGSYRVENNHFINGGSSFYNKHGATGGTCIFRYNYIEQNYAGHYGFFSNNNGAQVEHNIMYAPTASAGAVTIGDANGGKPNPLRDQSYQHNTVVGKFYTKADLGGCHYNSLDYGIVTGQLMQNDGASNSMETSFTYNLLYTLSPSVSGTGNITGQRPSFLGTGSYDKQTSIANYALRSTSSGYRACPDGSDMGANVALVGPDAVTVTTPPSAQGIRILGSFK